MSITTHGNGTKDHEAVVASTEDQLRAEALASLKRKRKFGEDAVAFLAVNAVLWVIWALTDRSSDPIPWPLWVTAIWGVFLGADAWRAFAPWPRSFRAITEEDVDRELRRLSATGSRRAR
jgi:2TM domain